MQATHPKPNLNLNLLRVFLLGLGLVSFLQPSLAFARDCDPEDEAALLMIKKHFGNFSNPKWDPKTDCCYWRGIHCNSRRRVSVLDLFFEPKSPVTIPLSIGDLSFLESLKLSTLSSKLTGSIPQSVMTKLTRLSTLDLSGENLTGPIPEFSTQLTYLDLSHNQFNDSIPKSLGKLTKLNHLDLSANHFSGSIPCSLTNLTQLNYLGLQVNYLYGQIPDCFGPFKNPKMQINLAHNYLSGPIPKSLGQNTNIASMDLSRNMLTGDASLLFGKNKTALEILYLDHNNFEFDISKVEFPQGLRNLDINNNKISGGLSSQLGDLPLYFIDVSDNNLCGPIPKGLAKFPVERFAHNDCLCDAPLPPCEDQALQALSHLLSISMAV